MNRHKCGGRAAAALALAVSVALPAQGEALQEEQAPGRNRFSELMELPLEELLNVQVTSVAKKPQKLTESAAAVFVITQEDIRRSGLTSLPELLRIVPGMDVGRINSNAWGVSARGFNNSFANKLLVLIDGRSVYTPTFSGVYWDVQDLVLENIERIEVIRGPGGTLWGANAVNGVVNVITKNAGETQGGLVTGSAGNREPGEVVVQYGGRMGETGRYRVYGKGFDRDPFPNAAGADAFDGWDTRRAGFRADWGEAGSDRFMVQGDAYRGNVEVPYYFTSLTPPYVAQTTQPSRVNGGYGLLRWERALSSSSNLSVQAYFDRAERQQPVLDQRVDTFDLDIQHRFAWRDGHEIVWGMDFRRVEDEMRNTFTVSMIPSERRTTLYSAFVQDEVSLGEKWKLTLGSKFEHNDYTGFEFQPNIRAVWQPDQQQTFWGAVSRAVRTPSRSDSDIHINYLVLPGNPIMLLRNNGDPSVKAERLTAYELGYRNKARPNLFYDATVFYHRYRSLTTNEVAAPVFVYDPVAPHLLISGRFDNLLQAETYGLELAANWQVTPKWRLIGGYSWLHGRTELDPGSTDDRGADNALGNSPEHQFQLRSQLDLPNHLELDGAIYRAGSLSKYGVPSYTRLDLRLGWRPRKDFELSLVGQNLLDRRHREFAAYDMVASEVPRSFYVKGVWRF